MAIKNWTVTSQRVSERQTGLIKYAKYLIDNKHENHQNTKIIKIHNTIENFVRVVSSEAISLDLASSQKKGGRPVQSYAQSFVFSLPDSVTKPTPDQWKAITKDVLKEIAKKLGLKLSDLGNGQVFANVHDQEKPHLNLVISRVVNGKALLDLDRKGTISVAKKAFNAATLARCGLDFSSYKPLKTNLGPRQEKWQLQQKAAEEALKAAGIETKKLNEEVEKAKGLAKYSAMLNSQMLKWIESIRDMDEKQESRQENRLYSTAEKLSELNLPQEQVDLLNGLFEEAEQKTGKTLRNRVRYGI